MGAITGNSASVCPSWGQPAIMVTSALSGGTPTIYLAVSCFNSNFKPLKSYVLSTTCLNLNWGKNDGSTCGNQTAQQDWTVTAGDFGWDQVAGLQGVPSAYPGGSPSFAHLANYITELDWAMRADNSVVAVLTFGYNPNSTGQMPTSYGCLALNFNPVAGGPESSPNNPFSYQLPTGAYSGVIAYIWDNGASPPANTSETAGPGACTYDPHSNAGLQIDRQLGGQALDPFAPPMYWPPTIAPCGMKYCPYSTYSIVASGVFP